MQTIFAGVLALLLTTCSTAALATTGGGNITFTPANIEPVHFSHDYHLKTVGIKCMACHFQKFSKSGGGYQMVRGKMTKRDFCSHCHNGLKGFDADSEKNCKRCHSK